MHLLNAYKTKHILERPILLPAEADQSFPYDEHMSQSILELALYWGRGKSINASVNMDSFLGTEVIVGQTEKTYSS